MNEFWDEYKRLEQLCNDIYRQQHGVSLYIDEMKDAPVRFVREIEDWDYVLRMLHRVRGIRNSMAHDAGVNVDDYDSEDLDFLWKFHEMILNVQDPLAVLRRLREEASRPKPKAKPKAKAEAKVEPEMHLADENTQKSNNEEVLNDIGENDSDERLGIKEIIVAFAIGGGIGGLIAFIYFFLL